MTRRVFHLIEPAAWAAAQAPGVVTPSSLQTEGFVHCSTEDQVVGTITRHFNDSDALVLLELDEMQLGADLRWEESRPGEAYPHLYRPIALSEVRRAVAWQRGPDGSVALPAQI